MSWWSRLQRRARDGKVLVRSVSYANSPLLAARTPPWRSKFLVGCIGAVFCLLLGRALYIQVIGTDFYQRQGESRYARTLELPANRGRIIDRNGLILASSVPAPSIWAIPKDLEGADPASLAKLARLLGMTQTDLVRRLGDNPNFVWLRRQVDEDLWKRVKALGLKGVHQSPEYKRLYPEGEAAAHVVGFTNAEDQGQEGIELAYQEQLAGRKGSRRVIRDRLGGIIEDLGESVLPQDGRDIELTIDSKVQFFAYQKIREAVGENNARAGSVVVLDVQTGDVLALANYPSYAPGRRQNRSGEQVRNRALTDTFEPGSTMKPFTVGLALEAGRVSPGTTFQTSPGSITVGGSTIRDSHAHGLLTVSEIIQKSSNVGTVKIARLLQAREMHELFTAVGFGQKPPLRFPGTVAGRLRPYKTWRPIEQATMSYGYGLSVSLLQLARAYTVFATDGRLMPIALTRDAERAPIRQVLSPQTARAVREMLQMAAGPGGTAPQAQTNGYSVGGKTGTARKQVGNSYAGNKYRAWFVGVAPVSRPRIVVAVMVDEPSGGSYYGGTVAGPVFGEVVQQTLRLLGVPPDLQVEKQIKANRPVPAVEESF